MREEKEALICHEEGLASVHQYQDEGQNAERGYLLRANTKTKGMMACELMAEGIGRESVARVLHVTTAELEDLLDRLKQQLSSKQGECA